MVSMVEASIVQVEFQADAIQVLVMTEDAMGQVFNYNQDSREDFLRLLAAFTTVDEVVVWLKANLPVLTVQSALVGRKGTLARTEAGNHWAQRWSLDALYDRMHPKPKPKRLTR